MKDKKTLISILSYGVLIALMFFLPFFISGPYVTHILIMIAINITLASSLRLINLSGQMSLAHGGMMTIGAYTSTLLVTKLGFSSWLALLLAGLFASVIACLVGFPFVRIKGVYFALCSIFLSEIIILIVEQWRSLTKGSSGIYNIPRPDPIVIPGILKINFTSGVNFYYLMLVIMLVSLIILYAIEHSRIGLTFRGIQQSASLAESVGIHTAGYKVLAFSIGCFFPGIAGGFYSQYMSAITPTAFGFLFAIYILIYMIFGGAGRFIGPIIGALILTVLPQVMRPLKEFQPFFFAAVLMLIIFFMPEGIIGLPKRSKKVVSMLFGKRTKRA